MAKVSIELDVESSGFVSGIASAEHSVKSLTQAMKKADDEGRDEDFARLQIQRDRLAATTSGFRKDNQKLFSDPRLQTTMANGASGVKLDAEHATVFKDLNSAIKKLTSIYTEQINSDKEGDLQEAYKTLTQIQQKQGEYKKAVEQATAPAMGQGMQNAVKAIGIDKIASSINEGFARWAGSLDRSGIINQYGSGDILGGRLSEKRRQADLWGGLAQTGLGLAGTVIGAAGNPLLGALLSLGGTAINAIAQGLVADESNKTAYAELWQQRSGDAMQLAALTGNPNMVRDAFKTAADAAAAFGYSAEEGMEAMKQAAMQGLDEDQRNRVTEQIFQYERSTGADRGTLSSVALMSERYGMGDALRAGWAGLGASGMTPGQYNEYLRALQRVMEDGISKGFSRSSETVAQNLTLLAHMTDNNPLWQGENGARRLMDMNAGLESATGLKSTSDIIAYRAAMNVSGSNDILDAMEMMEGGLTADLFKEYMRLTTLAEGGGNELDIVSRMMQTFNLNFTNARALYKGYLENPNMGTEEVLALMAAHNTPLPNASSPELEAAIVTQSITNWWTQTGQSYWDKKIPTSLGQEIAKAINEYNKETGSNEPVPYIPGVTSTPMDTQKLLGTSAPYLTADGSARFGHFSAGLQEFIAAEGRRNDPNAQAAAGRFNREILPRLPENIGNGTIDLIDELQMQFYRATQGIPAAFGEAGNKVGANELATLNATMDAILRQLGTLDNTLDKLAELNVTVDIP